MKEIFVNLKRFEVPQKMGGICLNESPVSWMKDVVRKTVELGIGRMQDLSVVYFLPEALLVPAKEVLEEYSKEEVGNFTLGCQSVYRRDVEEGKNFGAFTSNRPAAAVRALDYQWTMVGHSEERQDKLEMLAYYDESIAKNTECCEKAAGAVDILMNEEVRSALKREMNVLLCIGETQAQKGSDIPCEYEPRVKKVLRQQLTGGLRGVRELKGRCRIAIGYEPVWAIGPGKKPPEAEYIRFVSQYIKEVCREEFGEEFSVVYGGGLKEENAAEIASVNSIGGGLVALTKFDPPIGFEVESLKKIMQAYIQ